MATPASHSLGGPSSSKRKITNTTTIESSSKKQCVEFDHPSSTSMSLQPQESLLAKLRAKYEVKTMSVVSSTSICKHIDKALVHLGRFSFLDNNILPGIVLLYGKSKAANKAITIAETIRRRIAEGDQKWYQYNLLYEIASLGISEHEHGLSSVDDGMPLDAGNSAEGHHNGVESQTLSIEQTVFDIAIEPAQDNNQAVIVVFLSRVPIAELLPLCRTGVQTNAHDIDKGREKRLGLI